MTFRAGCREANSNGWRSPERWRITKLEPGVVPEVYRIVIDDGATPEAVAATLSDRLGPDARTEVLDTGIEDLAPLLAVLWLIAIVLLVMAAVNLLSILLTSSREASRRVGVQLAVGFTPRQVLTHGAVSGGVLGVSSSLLAVPLGFWVFGTLSDAVSTSLGVGPAWLPAPSITSVLVIVVATSTVAAGLGPQQPGETHSARHRTSSAVSDTARMAPYGKGSRCSVGHARGGRS